MVSEIGNLDFLHFSCLSDLKNNSVHAFLYYPKVSGIKKDCLHFSKAAGKIIKINNRFFFFPNTGFIHKEICPTVGGKKSHTNGAFICLCRVNLYKAYIAILNSRKNVRSVFFIMPFEGREVQQHISQISRAK